MKKIEKKITDAVKKAIEKPAPFNPVLRERNMWLEAQSEGASGTVEGEPNV